jgi:hypothetical protein
MRIKIDDLPHRPERPDLEKLKEIFGGDYCVPANATCSPGSAYKCCFPERGYRCQPLAGTQGRWVCAGASLW